MVRAITFSLLIETPEVEVLDFPILVPFRFQPENPLPSSCFRIRVEVDAHSRVDPRGSTSARWISPCPSHLAPKQIPFMPIETKPSKADS